MQTDVESKFFLPFWDMKMVAIDQYRLASLGKEAEEIRELVFEKLPGLMVVQRILGAGSCVVSNTLLKLFLPGQALYSESSKHRAPQVAMAILHHANL